MSAGLVATDKEDNDDLVVVDVKGVGVENASVTGVLLLLRRSATARLVVPI